MLLYQKFCFFIIILVLPITNFIKGISSLGSLNGKLSTYFIIIALFLWVYDVLKNHRKVLVPKYFKIWAVIFLLLNFFTSIYGLYNVDYIFLEHEKLRALIDYTHIDVYVSEKVISFSFFFIKIVKNIIFNFLLTFGTSLWIYNLFFDNYQEGLKLFKYATMGVMGIFILYSIPETLYLLNFQAGQIF